MLIYRKKILILDVPEIKLRRRYDFDLGTVHWLEDGVVHLLGRGLVHY